jgi:hypothetical protein
MANPSDHVTDGHALARPNGDAARCEMGIQDEGLGGPDGDVISGETYWIDRWLARQVGASRPERGPRLSDGMHPLALGHSVDRVDHFATRCRVDGFTPPVAVPRPTPDEEPPQRPGGVDMPALAVVGTYEVIRVAHAEHVGAVTRYAMGRGLLHGPLASQREIHDDRVIELTQGDRPIERPETLPDGWVPEARGRACRVPARTAQDRRPGGTMLIGAGRSAPKPKESPWP